MKPATDESVQFSLRELLAVTAYIAVTAMLVSYTNYVSVGIHLSLALVGWIMWRFAHGHMAGIIPALVGGDLLLCFSVAWVLQGSEDFMGFRGLLMMVASFLVMIGLGVLVAIAAQKQRYWQYQVGIAVSILMCLMAWWLVIPTLGNAAIIRRQAADVAANNASTAQAIAMVEKAVEIHGQAPDLETLRKILSGPLPSVRWGGYSHEIGYLQTGEKTYQLNYVDPSMFFGDIVIYDSATPKRGWFRVPF